MAKSRSFSIYLLKENFNESNTLKEEHKLVNATNADNLPKRAILYILDNKSMPPWWKDYFKIQQNLQQTLKGAIVFLPVDTRCFALTFGHVFHNLIDTSYEYDFGLRVTLNSVDPAKLKSLDGLDPGNARRQRTQLPVGSDLTYFDFDCDSTILKSLTGKVKDEYKPWFKQVTGSSSIKISSNLLPADLPSLCEKLLELYADSTYLSVFPGIQNISPVKDPCVITRLNENLVAAIRSKDENLTLTIPEIVDYKDEIWATFSGGGNKLIGSDIFIDRYYEYLEQAEFKVTSLEYETLKKHHLTLTNEYGQPRGEQSSILKCLIFDTSLDDNDESYHLCEGNWYLVNLEYVSDLSKYLDPFCTDTTLPNYHHTREDLYNTACSEVSSARICMDKGNISPQGQKQVEPCDVFEVQDDLAILYHVKKSTVSATLSHLFNQGLNSIQLIRDNNEAREKLKKLALEKSPNGEKKSFSLPIENDNFKVSFQIITHKNKTQKSLNLPLFSRISLKRTMQELRRMNIKAEFSFVKDENHYAGEKKKRKKSNNAEEGE